MAGTKDVQFFVLISLMIVSTHALKVLLTDGISAFSYETTINITTDDDGIRSYAGCAINDTFMAGGATIKVIIYIRGYIAMLETTLRSKYQPARELIARVLSRVNYQLLYLGVDDFNPGDERLVGEFLLRAIFFNRSGVKSFEIVTLGEGGMNLSYETSLCHLKKYQEDRSVFMGNLQGYLRSTHI